MVGRPRPTGDPISGLGGRVLVEARGDPPELGSLPPMERPDAVVIHWQPTGLADLIADDRLRICDRTVDGFLIETAFIGGVAALRDRFSDPECRDTDTSARPDREDDVRCHAAPPTIRSANRFRSRCRGLGSAISAATW